MRPDVVVIVSPKGQFAASIAGKIEAVGAMLIYLPPYSPDFNPIEKAFSQIKAFLKAAAARTKENLNATIAKAVDLVTGTQAQNYFRSCGYESDTAWWDDAPAQTEIDPKTLDDGHWR